MPFSGRKLKQLLSEKRMPAKQLAEILGINENTVSRWIHGKFCPQSAMLSEVAKALGVKEAEFFESAETPSDTERNMIGIEFTQQDVIRLYVDDRLKWQSSQADLDLPSNCINVYIPKTISGYLISVIIKGLEADQGPKFFPIGEL